MKSDILKLNTAAGIKFLTAAIAAILAGGCALSPTWLPSSGPNYNQVQSAPSSPALPNIQVIEVNDTVTRKLIGSSKINLFSETFKDTTQHGYVIGRGDVIEVSIWEAPPAVLFGGNAVDTRSTSTSIRAMTLPEQMVNKDGGINIPFAGHILANGKSPQQIEAEIVRSLKTKANQPQVLVRVVRNNSANVTIVGEVASSTRMPLTARGEQLLDALAAAGGVRQPINKVTIQITRDNLVQALPLETIIRDPRQNIALQPGDIITSLFQPLSFTVLGATGKNEELNFEAQGISLAQALARAGGVQDHRADAQGVFIFRFESPEALDLERRKMAATPEGKIPVIYRVDLKDPATFFIAQSFPIRNKDVLYVSNSPAAELQKFLNIIGSVVYPVINVRNATINN